MGHAQMDVSPGILIRTFVVLVTIIVSHVQIIQSAVRASTGRTVTCVIRHVQLSVLVPVINQLVTVFSVNWIIMLRNAKTYAQNIACQLMLKVHVVIQAVEVVQLDAMTCIMENNVMKNVQQHVMVHVIDKQEGVIPAKVTLLAVVVNIAARTDVFQITTLKHPA